MQLADDADPVLVRLGGGARDIRAVLETAKGPMLIVHLHFDVRDAMGANAVNTACESWPRDRVDHRRAALSEDPLQSGGPAPGRARVP